LHGGIDNRYYQYIIEPSREKTLLIPTNHRRFHMNKPQLLRLSTALKESYVHFPKPNRLDMVVEGQQVEVQILPATIRVAPKGKPVTVVRKDTPFDRLLLAVMEALA
jgi:hypothetical protein